ncbi:MAG: dockerin type I domain-containing protein [Methanospirillum sp.]
MKPRSLLVLLVLLCAVVHSVSAEGPAIEWQRLLGGSSNEFGHSVQPTADGGYILLGGSSSSQNGDVTGTRHGSFTDFWVVKLDRTGTIQWQKLLGGTGNDEGYSVQQTTDGGYILLGSSGSSKSGDVAGTNHGGSSDVWVVKLNSAGTIQWQTLLGGSGYDTGRAVQQTADGGYVLLGVSESSQSGDVTGINHGSRDYWVVKLNGAGTIQWQRLLGGGGLDGGRSVRQTADGGYILLGDSLSSASGDVTGTNRGYEDFWVVKLDDAGLIEWQKTLGGSYREIGYSVQQAADGGYVLLGDSLSSESGDVTGSSHYMTDYWVVKLAGGQVIAVPSAAGIPGDIDTNGKYEDVNGNGRKDFADVVLYFNQMTWIAANEPVAAFDCNGNGRIDFADVVWLFNHL